MKTTVDLPDDLLIEAKAVAARRRTTLRDLITRSLRREIGPNQPDSAVSDSHFKVGPLGLPVLKSTGRKLSAEDIQKVIERIEGEDDETYLRYLRR
jgi:hypothetical protein